MSMTSTDHAVEAPIGDQNGVEKNISEKKQKRLHQERGMGRKVFLNCENYYVYDRGENKEWSTYHTENQVWSR